MWLICLLISHVDVAHGYFAYVNEISFAYPEHLVHEGVAQKADQLRGVLPQKLLKNLL